MPLFPDLVAEIDAELKAVDDRLAVSVERRAALELLRVRATTLAGALGRRITVFDLFAFAPTDEERERLATLMHALRGLPEGPAREAQS